ncbi:MAG: glycosyltransferase family 4 protein [Candidatus Taylorbacteria bacterium]|nr:glycosyltransferase family 4 protein [Candidatus Taylorbacteria bacterium]
MKICFFGIYDPAYSRNEILLSGLRQNRVEVIECREDWRDPKRYRKLWRKLRMLDNDYDYVYAVYPSSVPAIMAKFISKRPVIVDAFYSNFDSVVNDRRKYSRFDPRAVKMLIFDWLGVIFSDLVITDTNTHAKYWRKWWGMKNKKFGTVYVGVDDGQIHPGPIVKKDYTLIHFHGYFIPLQGTCRIIEAARLLVADSHIRFRLIGHGRDLPKAKKLAEEYDLKNVEFIDSVPFGRLSDYLTEADIVLGIFGDNDKTQRVIPNKLYEGLAAKRAVISMDTRAVREIFTDKDLLLVKNDAQSIANGILTLIGNEKLRADLSGNGYETVLRYTPPHIGKAFRDIIVNVFQS